MNSTWASSALFLPAISSLFTSLSPSLLPLPSLSCSPFPPSSSFPHSSPSLPFLLRSSLAHRPVLVWEVSPGCHSYSSCLTPRACRRCSKLWESFVISTRAWGALIQLKPVHLKRFSLALVLSGMELGWGLAPAQGLITKICECPAAWSAPAKPHSSCPIISASCS